MPKLTVLDMTQDILSDMDSDEVSSINDTVEALQVAQILKTTYYELIHQRDWPHLAKLFQLTASGDNSKPTHMSVEDNIAKVEWIKYDMADASDTQTKYTEVDYYTPSEFMSKINSRDSGSSDITTVFEDSIPIYVYNDRSPTFYTTFDDETLIFDAYESDLENTLQTAKTQCWGYVEPSFTLDDTFVPDLPVKAFPFYLAEAKSVAFNSIKQFPNAKEEQRSRRQRYRISREARRNEGGGVIFPNYGRRK